MASPLGRGPSKKRGGEEGSGESDLNYLFFWSSEGEEKSWNKKGDLNHLLRLQRGKNKTKVSVTQTNPALLAPFGVSEKNYVGQPALLSRHYRGTTTVRTKRDTYR